MAAASSTLSSSSSNSPVSHGHHGRRGHMHHGRKQQRPAVVDDQDYELEEEGGENKLAREVGDGGRGPDELVVGDVRERLAENVTLDGDHEIGREGGEGRLHALRDAEQDALERRGYGGDEAPYAVGATGADDLDDRSEQVDIGRSA